MSRFGPSSPVNSAGTATRAEMRSGLLYPALGSAFDRRAVAPAGFAKHMSKVIVRDLRKRYGDVQAADGRQLRD